MIQELTKKVRKIIHGDEYEEKLEVGCKVNYGNLDGIDQDCFICSEEQLKHMQSNPKIDWINNLGKPLETREVLLVLMKKDIRFGDHTDDKSLWVKVEQGMEIIPLTQQPKEWSEDIISKLIEIL